MLRFVAAALVLTVCAAQMECPAIKFGDEKVAGNWSGYVLSTNTTSQKINKANAFVSFDVSSAGDITAQMTVSLKCCSSALCLFSNSPATCAFIHVFSSQAARGTQTVSRLT